MSDMEIYRQLRSRNGSRQKSLSCAIQLGTRISFAANRAKTDAIRSHPLRTAWTGLAGP